MTTFEVWVAPEEQPADTILKRIKAKDLEHVREIVESISPCMRVVAALKEIPCPTNATGSGKTTPSDSSAEGPCPPISACSERLTVCSKER